MNTDVILKAENLDFSYDEGRSYALKGLSLELKRGRKIIFMGANGSGKSTFFLCCAGVCKPQRGRLYFNGKEIAYDKKSLLELRSKVGIVFQDPDNQLFSASVYQEISFGILNLGVSEEQAKKRGGDSYHQLGNYTVPAQADTCFKRWTEKTGVNCRYFGDASGSDFSG